MIALLILGLVILPFFALGVKRSWLFASIFWVAVGAYTIFLFQQPVEEQEAAAWRLVMLAVLGGSGIAFAGGFLTSIFKSKYDPDLKETFE